MAPTFNQQLFDAMVRHQVGLLRFSGGVRNKVWKLLDATEADLRHQIEDKLRLQIGKPVTPARLQRIQGLLDSLKETRLKAWKDVNATWASEMKGLALAEPGFVGTMMSTAVPVELGLEMPSTQRLAAIVNTKPFMGATLKQWADGESKADIARIHQQIKIGLVQGEGIPEISRRIVGSLDRNGSDGVTAKTRRNAEAITRTATNAIAAESRKELFEANKELMSGELFTATLDSKTTPVCRAYDGKIFHVGEPPDLPLHWNERSVRSPIVDGEIVGDRPYRNFTEKQLLREYAAANGIEPAPKTRNGLPRGTKGDYDTFARARMRELTGTVPAKTSYQEWLKTQTPANQDDILGPARGKLFRDGQVTLDQFVDDTGKQFTLEQLGESDSDAFVKAGLQPGTGRPLNSESDDDDGIDDIDLDDDDDDDDEGDEEAELEEAMKAEFDDGDDPEADEEEAEGESSFPPAEAPDLPRGVPEAPPNKEVDYTEWVESLSEHERNTIKGWTGAGYTAIRSAQRGLYDDGDLTPGSYGFEAKLSAKRMTDALERAPKRAVTVYRGTSVPASEFRAMRKSGGWELDANASFSERLEVAKWFAEASSKEAGFVRMIAEVRMKNGGPNLTSVGISKQSLEEHEVVGLKGQKFRILSATKQNGQWYVVAEEI